MAESLFTELKRRNVFKVMLGYIILGWVVLQVADVIVPALGLPDQTITFLLMFGFLGAPFVIFFSWAFEITPEGLKRDHEVNREVSISHHTGRKIDFLIIGLLVVALGFFIYRSEFVRIDSHEVNTSSEITDDNSIAVLPFVNMSSDKEQEYFSDGLSEELLNLLAKIPQLRVIARTSSFSFKGEKTDIANVAKKLNVSHILEGSVRKSGTTLRITAQLIRASNSSHLWSETYDREMTDVFAVQDEIAKAVVAALKLKLLPEQQLAIIATKTINPEAYNQYLLGRNFFRKNTVESWKLAQSAFQKAIALAPNYAPAYAELAQTVGYLADDETTVAEINAGKEKARQWAEKAIALAPELADGYRARSKLLANDSDFTGAMADLQQALKLNPGNSDNQRRYGLLLMNLGRLDEALVAANKAAELDPLSASALNIIAYIHNTLGQYSEAQVALNSALQLSPSNSFVLNNLLTNYLLQGDTEQALATVQRLNDDFWHTLGLALVQHSLGQTKTADEQLALIIKDYANGSAFQIAEIYAWRGETDLAFLWLQRAYDQRDGGLSGIKTDPLLNSLHQDPRFAELVKKMGLPL